MHCTPLKSNASARARHASLTNSELKPVSLLRTKRISARTFAGNPYDDHTLHLQLEQTRLLLEDAGSTPKQVIADLGFRGVDADNPTIEIIYRGKYKSLTKTKRRWFKRRQAVEPAIGHLKSDHRMDRCWLQGQLGDALHAVLC